MEFGAARRLTSLAPGVWRSLVAHSLWERGAVGSNPATPTREIRSSRRQNGAGSGLLEAQISRNLTLPTDRAAEKHVESVAALLEVLR